MKELFAVDSALSYILLEERSLLADNNSYNIQLMDYTRKD